MLTTLVPCKIILGELMEWLIHMKTIWFSPFLLFIYFKIYFLKYLIIFRYLFLFYLFILAAPCGIFVSQPGMEPVLLKWKYEVLTAGLPGNSLSIYFYF